MIKMKLACLVVLLTCSGLSAKVWSQQERINLKFEQVSFVQLFDLIQQKTNLKFVFNHEDVQGFQANKQNFTGKTVSEILDVVFKGKPFAYEILADHIVVSRVAQEKKHTVKGNVVDETGLPLPGVSVIIKGTTVGVATDADGNFQLEIAKLEGVILQFTMVGMKMQEVKLVPNRLSYNVIMQVDAQELEDVVCTGYQTLKKVNTTGSFSTISPQAIELRGSAGLNRLLEGKVPGLTIYNDDVRIRGGSTISKKVGTKPLYIVDGFEVDELPENMDLVERITVLKDAAAAAIWGTRAANGVIVIEMKKGTVGHSKLSYSGNVNLMCKPDFSDLNRADSKTLVDYDLETFDKELIFGGIYEDSANGYSPSLGWIFEYEKNNITRDQLEEKLMILGGMSNKKQIEDKLLRTAIRHNHNISLSGGSEKFSYFLSGSYTGENSVYKDGSSKNSINILSKNTYVVAPRISVRADLNAVYGKEDHGYDVKSVINTILPYQMLVDEEGNRVKDYANFNIQKNQELVEEGYKDYGFNVLDEIDLANNKTNKFGLRAKVGLDVTILDGLKLSADYQYERTHSETKNLQDEETYAVRERLNYMTNVEDGKLVNHLPMGDILDMKNEDLTAHALKIGGILNRSFGKEGEHYVNVVAGFELRKHTSKSNSYRKLGYDDELLSYQLFDEQELAKTGIDAWDGYKHTYDASYYDKFSYRDNREVSYYGSAVYTYDSRYTLSGTFRIDESNLFGAAKKYRRNPLWSVGLSWNVNEEDFFHSNVINRLAPRISYGLTGNFDRSGSSTPLLTVRRSFNSAIGAYLSRVSNAPNPKLRWERTKTLNIGVETELFNRLSFMLEYYDKRSYDLLGNVQIDPTLGFDGGYINAADMRNRGVEMQLNAEALRLKDFSWFVNFVFGYNKNKITNNNILDGDPAYNRTHAVTEFVKGYPREALWSYRWAGLDEDGNPQTYDAEGNKTRTPVAESIEYNGTYRPKYSGSLSTDFKYKNLLLSFAFVYNFGHVFRIAYPTMNPLERAADLSAFVAKRWQKPGDENKTDIPATLTWESYDGIRQHLASYSSNSVRKGDFIRLREITLNYELPSQLIKKTPFSRVSLTAQANTVWMWTKNKEGFDPEAVDPIHGTLGLSEAPSFTFGLRVEF